jgi:hypothetical protein
MDVMTSGSWVHCGREFSAREVADICATVAWLPGLARSELAATLCEHLGWVTLTGTAKTGACLEFLQRLQAAGLLVLPAQRAKRAHRSTARCPAPPRTAVEALVEESPVAGPLSALAPVRLEVIRDTALAAQWDELMARWHPLGFQGAFGYRLRYFITAGELRLGCALLSGAARAVAVRDDWIGWTAPGPAPEPAAGAQQQPLPDLPARPGAASGQSGARTTGASCAQRLARTLGLRAHVAGKLRRPATACRHLLPGCRLATPRRDQRQTT